MQIVKRYTMGCGALLIVLGLLGFLSLVVDLGTSNRAVWVIFIDMAKRSGSVPVFSGIIIAVGGLVMGLVYLIDEVRKPD
jgi:hypothetical protein